MTIKLKYNKERFILFAILALCIFSCLILPGMITMLLSVLAMGYMAVAEKNALVKKNKITNSLFLVIPVFFSAFQNVYLAIGVNHQSSLSLQIMLSLHILLIMMMIILNSKLVFSKIPNVLLLLLVLLAYGLVMYVAYPAPITSLISASRNIISCMLIYVYAYTIGEVSDERAFYRYLNLIAWVVVLFGIYEYLGGIGIWKNLGITQLWNLKGIKTNVAGVPMNWFSSEKIGGQQLRRMVSTFADPVNLGTYLFAAFMISWYSGEKMLTLLLVGCCMNILYVGFISLAPDVIHIAGTKEYYDGISMVIPLSFAIYFIFLYSLPVHIEYFYKKTKFIATGTSLAAGINIALNYFFIRSYGYTASAWTTLASYFLLFVFHWFIAKKIDGNPMFPKKTIIGSIIALSTFSAWTILIINHMLIRWISMLLFIVLSLICNSKTILPLTDKLASKLKNG